MFVTFDGIDGAGKSTQMSLFTNWLKDQGHEVVTCRDPGTTRLGETVREILLGADYRIDYRAEMLLYMACRAQLVQEVIRPALEAGKTVVSDRFILATVAYQGLAGGIEPDDIWRVGEIATEHILPDLTFVLDLDPALAAMRLQGDRDRLEARGLDYFKAVRQGFRQQAERFPRRHLLVDASCGVDEIQSEIRSATERMLDSS